MSIEATEYVKKLQACPDGAPLSRNQKLLLFVLADYHSFRKRAAWPSLCTLARESLLSLAQVKRELAYVRLHGIIWHEPGGGRGRMTCYGFPALDAKPAHIREPVFDQTGSREAQVDLETGSKQAQGAQRNKEEPGEPFNLERTPPPSNGNGKSAVPDLRNYTLEELRVIERCYRGRNETVPAGVLAELERRTNGQRP